MVIDTKGEEKEIEKTERERRRESVVIWRDQIRIHSPSFAGVTVRATATTPITPSFPTSLISIPTTPRSPRSPTTTTMVEKRHILLLPTELLAGIFEAANFVDPFLSTAHTDTPPSSATTSPPVVDEIHCTLPLDKYTPLPPLSISQTCTRFRQVALSTPALWSRITIYREPSSSPTRWSLAKLFLARATRHYMTLTPENNWKVREGAERGLLDVRIFGGMFGRDSACGGLDWSEGMINERWFGSSDMEEVLTSLPFPSHLLTTSPARRYSRTVYASPSFFNDLLRLLPPNLHFPSPVDASLRSPPIPHRISSNEYVPWEGRRILSAISRRSPNSFWCGFFGEDERSRLCGRSS